MTLALWVGLVFLLAMLATYGIFLKKVSPISIFVVLALVYVLFPVIFDNYENQLFETVAKVYMKYDGRDLEYGMCLAVLTLLPPFAIDIIMIKKIMLFRRLRHQPKFQGIVKNRLPLKMIMVVSFFFYILGIYSYGVDSYFKGYQDELGIGTNYGSFGGSIIAAADIMFFVSAGVLSRLRNSWGLVLTVLIFIAIHFMGGSRLMSAIGFLMIVLVHNNFLIDVNKKFIIYLCLTATIFTIIGMSRGSVHEIAHGFMEFAFVGFGYYNVIATRPPLDVHMLYFIKDLLIFSLPSFFDKAAYMETTGLILEIFRDARELTPVGGISFLTETYLYIGLLSPIAVFIVFYAYSKIILFLYKLEDSKFSLLYAFFVGLMCSFVLVNLLRNGVFPAASAALKSVAVFVFFIIFLRAYKFRIMKLRMLDGSLPILEGWRS